MVERNKGHSLAWFRRPVPVSQWRWMHGPFVCCVVCGKECSRDMLAGAYIRSKCSDCGMSYDGYDPRFFFLLHDCPYSPLEGDFGVDFAPSMDLESVSDDGLRLRYAPKGDGTVSAVVVSDRLGAGFAYWRLDAFKGALLAMVEHINAHQC